MFCYFIRMGFHWPPFYTIGHLHLHAISPVSSMSTFNRLVAFNPSFSYVFVDVWTIFYLRYFFVCINLMFLLKQMFIGRLCSKTYRL